VKRLASLWGVVGSSKSVYVGFSRAILYAIFGVLTYLCVTLRFDWKQQAVVGFLTLAIVFTLYSFSRAYVTTLMLIVASLLTTCRYAVWRVTQVYQAVTDPSSDLSWIELFFMFLLLAAEMYAFSILVLGFIQTIYPLRRPPVPLPPNSETWPEVDVLIPTYNEPLSVVRSTVLAAINIDYPNDKMHVYLLDDGRRKEFRGFCEQVGIGYITRSDNLHAKAGNINRALTKLKSPLVAIFDCDHVPTRSFLQVTVGWFLKERKLGMLQTPHHFYSPDPFERNLGTFGLVPDEGELFYGLLQDGNDLWNATFFCGSCAVLRRTALDEIGGIAVETVTEDAHTSLRMQTRGWNTAYINTAQAAGLATESLSAHVGQRIRWARGMVQILRIDNPLFARGLKLPQRLCYFNAMVHFLYALPRLIFLTAPLVYMLLGLRNIPGLWLTIAAYALPHLFVSNMTNSRIQGKYRHSFWNEIYETVLAPYILGPTLLALINPKLGKFNVTAKGGIVRKRYFDKSIARPYRYLLLLNYIGLAVAPWRFYVHNADHKGAVLMNVFWILFNCVILGTANAVAVEAQQLRTNVRLNRGLAFSIRFKNGAMISALSTDLSLGGGAATLGLPAVLEEGEAIEIIYPLDESEVSLPARVVGHQGTRLRFQYRPLSLEEEESLTLVLYSRADAWLPVNEPPPDRPLKSLAAIMRLSLRGIRYSFTSFLPSRGANALKASVETAAGLLLCLLLLYPALLAQPPPSIPPGHVFRTVVSLADMGVENGIMLRGGDTFANAPLVLSGSQVAQGGTLHLRYSFSPDMLSERSSITVSFNDTALVDLVMPSVVAGADSPTLSADIPIPAELLATRNTLGIHLRAHYAARCENPRDSRLWARVEPTSTFEISGILLPIVNDLAMLPSPFYEKEQSVSTSSIAVAFGSLPSPVLLRAAGAVSSWFGVQANSHKLIFPVFIDHLPPANSIVLARNDSPLLAFLGQRTRGPQLAMRVNPADGVSKLLVVSGDDEEQVLAAALALAAGRTFNGESAIVEADPLPALRGADDAPRWVQTTVQSSLWSYAETNELRTNVSQPIASYVRIPPDLFFGDREAIKLRLQYAYKDSHASQGAFLRVTANGSQVSYLPLAMKDGNDKTQSVEIPIPIRNLRPFANTLLFEFLFQPASPDFCRPQPPSNSTGTLFRSSNLDLSQFPHWGALPNLELFANAGFPFTRFADLSQTTIVLPDQPSEREITTMLNLLAYFGAQTGYPALRVQVGNLQSFNEDRSLLIIGSESDMPTTAALDARLPLNFEEGAPTRRLNTMLSLAQRLWTRISHLDRDSFSDIRGVDEESRLDRSLGEKFDSVIEAVESPTIPHRSVVVVVLGRSEQNLFPAFLRVSSSGQIQGNVAIQHGSRFDSFSIGQPTYHVGYIGPISRIRAWMHQEPWAGVLLPFIIGMLYAPWVHAHLKRRAIERLRGDLT
jgi:cellulose synthase (UDP-forming)